MVDHLSNSSQAKGCFIKQAFRYYQIQTEAADDSCLLSDAYARPSPKDSTPGSIVASLKELFSNPRMMKRRYQ